MAVADNPPQPKAGARPRTASRVAAVQALFQSEQAQTSPETVIDEFIRHRLGNLPGSKRLRGWPRTGCAGAVVRTDRADRRPAAGCAST